MKAFFRRLRNAWVGAAGTVGRAGAPLWAILLVTQVIIVGVAYPVTGWLMREALRAGGMSALDLSALVPGPGLTVTAGLLAVIVTFAFWLVVLQVVVIVSALDQTDSNKRIRFGVLLRDCGRAFRRIAHPRAFPLLAYLLLLLPLMGLGFLSLLTRGVAIPPFVSGELAKSPATALIIPIFLIVLGSFGVRWSHALMFLVRDDCSPGTAMRSSWQQTKGFGGALVFLGVSAIVVASTIAHLALLAVSVLPTWVADQIAPDAAPVVAAFSLGAAQVAIMFASGLTVALIAAVMLELTPRTTDVPLPRDPDAARPVRTRRTAVAVGIASVAIAVLIGATAITPLRQVVTTPNTLVLAHRGFPAGGVENTTGGLEAAAAAGADLVEIDVMQTRDGEFVVMHDVQLSRLAGLDLRIADASLAELTSITVHDSKGHADLIPSLATYITRAEELGMRLLIEIKLSGAETPDHVARLVAELDDLGALDTHIYHSLDPASVSELKRLRPDLSVGYTMALAAGGVPDTVADFVVVEEWTASDAMLAEARSRGMSFMVWTVNDDSSMRSFLRMNVDGIITDHPDALLRLRERMASETGLAAFLADTVRRFITVF